MEIMNKTYDIISSQEKIFKDLLAGIYQGETNV
jgi:hypothetical protein